MPRIGRDTLKWSCLVLYKVSPRSTGAYNEMERGGVFLGGRFAVSRPTFDAMEAERVCRRLAAWVGCLGWVLDGLLGLVCLKVGCLELDKACYLATGRRLKGPFESCAPPSNKGKLCVCQLIASTHT